MSATHQPRSRDQVRRGAKSGVAQVFTAQEAVDLLDRIEELERIERAAEAVVTCEDDLEDAVVALRDMLAARRSNPS